MIDVAAEIDRCVDLMKDPDAVFVFGSNQQGIHGAGAARTARLLYGAVVGVGEGPTGRAYAIPTKATWRPGASLPLAEIELGVLGFRMWAERHLERLFVVTRIGCGYAGYTDRDISPMFEGAPVNCELPPGWRV